MRLLTRGLTGPAAGLVTAGFGPAIVEVVRIIKAGGRVAKRYIADTVDNFKITAELYAINGRYLIDAIFSRRDYFRNKRKTITVKIKGAMRTEYKKNDVIVLAKIKNVRKGWIK